MCGWWNGKCFSNFSLSLKFYAPENLHLTRFFSCCCCMNVPIAYRMGFDLSLPNYLTSFFPRLALKAFQSSEHPSWLLFDVFFWLFAFPVHFLLQHFFAAADAPAVSLLFSRIAFCSVDCLLAALVYFGMLIDTCMCSRFFHFGVFVWKAVKKELNISPKNIRQNFFSILRFYWQIYLMAF